MKKLLILSLLLLPSQLWAQQPVSPDTPVTLSITIAKADKIWRGLRKLPVEEVEELMNEIRQQVATQTVKQDNKDVPAPSKP